MQKWVAIAIVVVALAGCSKKPSAAHVCEKLVTAGAAANCKAEAPGGIGAAARERVTFDIPGLAGKTGQVLSFEKDGFYDATTKAFEAAAALAGRHQYGNRSALIFVQMNSETPNDAGSKAKAVVEGL